MEEIEIKFAVKDVKAISEKLRKLGFRLASGRHPEKNYLFDDRSGDLRKAGKLLRVRKTPSSQTVTFKGPILASSKLKHRAEIECRFEYDDTVIRILDKLGSSEQSIRSIARLFERRASAFRETEAGNYLEVEGPSDEEITNLGEKLGYSEKDFVRRTYAELIGDTRRSMTNEKDVRNGEPLEMVAVAGPAEAQMIEEMLKNNGIDSSLQGDVASTPLPTMSDLDDVRIFVKHENAGRAQEIVDAFFTPVAKDN
jgi:predicted adenylyl cyclase CyaB